MQRDDDLTQEFWGDKADWAPAAGRSPRRNHAAGRSGDRAHRRVPVADNEATLADLAGIADDTPIPARAGRSGVYLDEPTARLGAVAARRPRPPLPDFDDLDETDGYEEPDVWADVRTSEARPTAGAGARRWAERVGLGAVDPLIARLGLLTLVTALLVPVGLSMRGDAATGSIAVGAPIVASAPTAPPATETPTQASTAATTVTGVAPSAEADTSSTESADTNTDLDTDADDEIATTTERAERQVAQYRDTATSAGSNDDGVDAEQSATVDEPAERISCGNDYTVVAGDSWYRIAEGAEVGVGDLLDVNGAAPSSVLLPGDEICLPAGAATPPAPSTTVATTQPTGSTSTSAPSTSTSAPSTTAAATTTTAAATTTAAPTTTTAPSYPAASATEVQQIIRDVWPDELEEQALAIAYRESRFVSTADNGWCCVGLFQIYWSVHQSWLDDYGITSRNDLKDARKNVEAAYALYQRAGNSFRPWGG